MAVIRDVIAAFELFQPASTDDAIRLFDKYGADALVFAGGLDSMDWLKDRLRRPKVVVDLARIKELHGIKEANGGLEIGAMTPLTEVVKHPVVRTEFSAGTGSAVAQLVAAEEVANLAAVATNGDAMGKSCGVFENLGDTNLATH
jgi:xanthine dehydrogenase YagS FAD-binding subunit